MPLLIREHEVEQLLPMQDALALVEAALRRMGEGQAQNRPRQRVTTSHGVLHVMPASDPDSGYLGFKAYTSFRGKSRFYFHLFDAASGDYLAIIQADRLGQIRTGAASGVATRYLAREDAVTLGLLGTGWQAESQLVAICAVRPIRQVKCYSRDPSRRQAFADRMVERTGVPVRAVPDAADAVRECDIISTITSAAHPILKGEWVEAGAHINAAGGNWAHRRELDDVAVMKAERVFVDSLEQARIESGDLIQPAERGLFDWSRAQELGSLIAGRVPGRTDASEITLFKSNGIALEDVAVAGFVYERARAAGLGVPIEL